MGLRVVGAGLPRTGTESLRYGLQRLMGGSCCHMSALAGHPFNLGADWDLALAGGAPDWGRMMEGYNAAVDWPASMFWRELSEANPEALVLLSVRDSAQVWWESLSATILPYARMAMAPDWNEGRGLLVLFERFTGTKDWDDPARLMAAYERHNTEVVRRVPRGRLLEWRAQDGWEPVCRALKVRVPEVAFPWKNRREDWK